MAEQLTFKIEGLRELEEKLRVAAPNAAKKIIRESLSEGSEIILNEMQKDVQRDTGFLEEHLNKHVRLFREDLVGLAHVGPQGKLDYPPRGYVGKEKFGKKKAKGPGRVAVATVARFLEFGVRPIGSHLFPFMVASFEAVRESVLDKVIAKVKEGIDELQRV